ncbi:MAG: radical SAM family heme chaperone HemW [Planctomycetes bacterium]|nr:radical SAM family heme chaperone HemW [Planctomycetota bacterium]
MSVYRGRVKLTVAPTNAAQPADLKQVLPGDGVRGDGLYVHVPFCRHKCHYCDFYSFVDSEDRQEPFVARMENELDAWARVQRGELQTLFVGGGTPTMLRADLLDRMLSAIRGKLKWQAGAEWTVEANPETVSEEIAATLAKHKVTRVSLGAQSFQPELLKALERTHDPASVGRAVGRLRKAGINSINLDLIYAVPGASIEMWRRDLEATLELHPEHMSCYGLMYESNTPLGVRHHRGEVAAVSEELEVEMHELAASMLGAAGYEHYEISNWAKPGHACKHNLLYWKNSNWFAAGPAASGHADGLRWRNVPRLSDWLETNDFAPVQDVESLEIDGQVGEAFMMGLRLLEGMPSERVEQLLALGERSTVRRIAIAQHLAEGLLEWAGDKLRLTARGRMLASEVAMALL